MNNGPFPNTDREIWRGPDEGCGDAYADSLFITEHGALGINCGGMVRVRPIRGWHKLAEGPLSYNKTTRTIDTVDPHPETNDKDQIALDAAYQIEALPTDLHEAQLTARIQLIVLAAMGSALSNGER